MNKGRLILLFCLVSLAAPAAAQRSVSGSWQWTSRPNQKKEQIYFSIDIKQTGAKVSGRYWFNQLTDGEGDDASFVLFVGTVNGETISIEFDPGDIHSIDEESFRYKRPRSPSTATLKLNNGKLDWLLTKGKVDAGDLVVPRQLTLSRVKTK